MATYHDFEGIVKFFPEIFNYLKYILDYLWFGILQYVGATSCAGMSDLGRNSFI